VVDTTRDDHAVSVPRPEHCGGRVLGGGLRLADALAVRGLTARRGTVPARQHAGPAHVAEPAPGACVTPPRRGSGSLELSRNGASLAGLVQVPNDLGGQVDDSRWPSGGPKSGLTGVRRSGPRSGTVPMPGMRKSRHDH
jgi:hypothetical protein